MKPIDLFSREPAVLLGGGDVPDDLATLLPEGPIVCADSGADHSLRFGLTPVAVTGDLDSISAEAKSAYEHLIVEREDQNATDFQKAVALIRAPFYYCFGFLGRRMDHSLAALSVIQSYPNRPIALVGEEDITLFLNASAQFRVSAGATVGVVPWPYARCASQGLKWELDGLDLALGGQISSSNQALRDEIFIKVEEGAVLVTLPMDALEGLHNAFENVRDRKKTRGWHWRT